MNRRDLVKLALAAPAIALPAASPYTFPARSVVPAKPAAFDGPLEIVPPLEWMLRPDVWEPRLEEVESWEFYVPAYGQPCTSKITLRPAQDVAFANVKLCHLPVSRMSGKELALPKCVPIINMRVGDILVLNWMGDAEVPFNLELATFVKDGVAGITYGWHA